MAVQINVAANQAALTASIQAGIQAYNQRFAQNNPINLSINSRAFSQPLGRITGDVKDFEAALAASNARVIAFGASTAVLGGVIRSFKELAVATIEVEKNLTDINRVFGLTTSQLQKFSIELFNVSKTTATSFNDASKAALEFSRQGLKAEDTLQRTKDALTLTRLAGISTANAVDALTSTVNGFAATGVTTTQILNKLVAVEQDYAVGAGDLAEALSRTGQAAQEAGVSLDQLNALVTSAQQSTARGGAVIGNALKTIFTRLQRTDTLDQLEAFNIAVRDVQGNILPAVQILQNFAGAYRGLADAQRAQLSEQVAGVYQVNILKAIVNDLNKSQGVYAGALQRGTSATNEAEIATAKLNKTLDALLSQTGIATQQLATNIGKVTFEPLAKYGTEQLKSFVESINELLEGEGIGSTFANGFLKGIRNIIAGPGAIAAFFTLFKLIQNSFTYLTQALPQIAGITTETQNRKNIEQSILQIMQQQGPAAQALAGLMGNQAAQAQLLLQIARQQTAEYQTQSTLAKQLASQLSSQGVRVKGSGGLQVTRAGGYIPSATKMAEVVGAQAGGYAPGRVVSSPVGGVMNTAEDVKYIPGFAQPFINPPANSKAGRAHRKNAINRTGVDPYMSYGFIPNFGKIDQRDYKISYPNKSIKDPKYSSYQIDLNKVTTDQLGAKKDLDINDEFVDAGLDNGTGMPNTIYDWISGKIEVIKYLNKDEVDKAIDTSWNGLFSNKNTWRNDPIFSQLGISNNLIDAAFDQTLAKVGFTKKDIQYKIAASKDDNRAKTNKLYRFKTGLNKNQLINTKEGFAKSLQGDKSNYIGAFYENLIEQHPNIKGAYIVNTNPTAPADLIPKTNLTRYKGIEVKNTVINLDQAIKKALRIEGKLNADDIRDENVKISTLPIYQPYGVGLNASQGFIPNFAIPMEAGRIPWFKKYSTLLKNTAGDKDVFRQKDFPTFGNGLDHYYATNGNPDMVGYLYEKFILSAMNIARKSSVFKTTEELGLKQFPVTDLGNTAAFDLGEDMGPAGLIGIQAKAGSKDNQSSGGGVIKTLTGNIERFGTQNPSRINDLKKAVIIYNDPRYYDPTGKNKSALLNPFEQSISGIVKPNYSSIDPSLKPQLTNLTDDLLSYYEKNKNTKNAKTLFGGFIPNFNMGEKMRKTIVRKEKIRPILFDLATNKYGYSGQDGKEYLYHKDIYNNKLKTKGADINDYDFAELPNLVRGFILANETLHWDFSGIQEESLKDANVRTKVFAKLDIAKAELAELAKKESKFKIKERIISPSQMAKDNPLAFNSPDATNVFSNGFIPNFAPDPKYIAETLKRIGNGTSGFSLQEQREFLSKFGAEKTLVASKQQVLMSRMLMSRMVDKLGLDYINSRSVDQLNKDVKNGYMSGALNFDVPESLRFTAARGFVPNFALPIMKGYAFNDGRIYNAVHHSDAWDSIDGPPTGAIKYARHNEKLLLQTKKAISPELKKNFLSRGIPESAFSTVEDVDKVRRDENQKAAIRELEKLGAIHQLSEGIKGVFDLKQKLYTHLIGLNGTPVTIPGGITMRELGMYGGVKAFIEREQKNGRLPYPFAKGFIPNFNLIKGRNSFQKNWLIETAKKRNLNLNDPDVFSKLATEFAKIYPNSQGMFGLSGGFIPNFAYKQAVMGLEESMSGNKAIFDTKPFPHIRNSSQPTFSSAIADHGGLSNALSDSMRGQKAAGLMSKGFVPNFAILPNNRNFDIVRFSNSIAKSVDNFSKQLSNKIISVKDNLLLGLDLMNRNFDPQKIQRTAESTAKKIISSISDAGSEFTEKISSPGINAINNVRNKFTRQNTLQSGGGGSSQRLTAAQMAASFGNLPTRNGGLEKFSESLSKASTAISIAGPMIAGLVEQAYFGNRKRTEMTSGERVSQAALSTGLTAISTGAGIGANFGPLGAGVGAAMGALIGLTSALNAATLTAEELAQLNEEQTQKAQANISAASSYVEAQKSLTDMVAKGASSTEIETATRNLANNFSQIKDTKLQEMFLSAGGDVAIMTRQLQEYTNQVSKESAKQTGLFGQNLKPEERASALSIGLGKQGSLDFIKNAREAAKNSQEEQQRTFELYAKMGEDSAIAIDFIKRSNAKKFAESQVPKNEPQRESKVQSLIENFLNDNFEQTLVALEKNISVTDYSKSLQSFRKTATESFESIFKKIERSLQQTAFETAMEFEKSSSQQRINAAVLDFTTSLTDQMTSFIMGNLPDLAKFQYAQKAATDKSSAALQKLSIDRSKFELEQENQKNEIIQKNAASLTKTFKESMLTSQANAEYFRDQVLTEFTKGNYNLNIDDFAKNMMQGRQADFQKMLGANALGLSKSFTDFADQNKINEFRTTLQQTMQTKIAETPEDKRQQVERSFNEMLLSFNDAINATELMKNVNSKEQLRLTLENIKEEKIRSDQRIANAEKEFTVNETIFKQKIKAEEILAVEKAKIDSQNMMRLKAMEAASKRLGFGADISKAQGEARISNIERSLNDPRAEFGMGARQITERRIQAERDILQERRGIEDAALSIEMQQAQMQLDAEIANTNALIDLNDAVLQLVNNNLSQTLGGSDQINRIRTIYNETGGLDAIRNTYGDETATNFQAYETNQLKLQSSQGAKNNVLQQDQQKLLQEQFQTRQRILGVQRQSIDADVAQKQQLERMKASFSGRFQLGLGGLRNEGDQILLKLGEDLPRMFGDGLVDGIKAAIRESDNLGEALMGIASKFLDEISTAMMRSAIYGILGSVGMGMPGVGQPLGGKQKGGIIRAQSGMYISGSGSGDKYPALLENGEYVLNRRAVMAMGGPANLDKLNFSMAPRFASGGSYSAELTDLKSMEEGMTTAGLENSPLYNELRDIERQKQEEKRQKRRKRKQMIAGIVGAVAGAAASFGINKAIGSFGSSLKKDFGDVTMNVTPQQLAQNANLAQKGGHVGTRLSDTIPAYAEGGLYNTPIVKKYGVGLQNGGMGSSVNNSNVVNNSNATNSFNFNTNVNRDGTIEVGANTTSYKQQDVELSQNLNNKIYGAVLDVIREQQRFGGSLAGTRRAT